MPLFSCNNQSREMNTVNVNNIIISTHTTEKHWVLSHMTKTIHHTLLTHHTNFLLGWKKSTSLLKLLQQTCTWWPPIVSYKKKERLPPLTPHPTIHLCKTCLYCLYTILIGNGEGRNRLNFERKMRRGGHISCSCYKYYSGRSGGEELAVIWEGRGRGGADQLTYSKLYTGPLTYPPLLLSP